MRRHSRRPSATRAIGYEFHTAAPIEGTTHRFLGAEKREGSPVTQFGTDGHILWINGSPGAALRDVVAKIEALGWIRRPQNTP